MATDGKFPMGTLKFPGLGTIHYLRGAKYETNFVYDEVFQQREYEHDVLRWWPGMTIVDVGANIGFFALLAQQKCDKNLRLLCIEPIPAIHAVLRKNLEDYGLLSNGAETLNSGLTYFNGPKTLEFMFYPRAPANSTCKKEEKEAGVELLKQWADDPEGLGKSIAEKRGFLGRLFSPLLRGLAKFAIRRAFEGIPVVCPLTTLTEACRSHRIESIDLLKIDVEGAEWDVLNGIDDGLWPNIQQLVLEVEDVDGRLEQVTSLLKQHGFTRIEAVRPQFAEGKPIKNYNLYAAR